MKILSVSINSILIYRKHSHQPQSVRLSYNIDRRLDM